MLFALVDEDAFRHIEHFSDALVDVRGDDRAGFEGEVEHYRSKRVIVIANGESDVALAGERKAIGFDLGSENFLIEHVDLLKIGLAN